MDVGVISNVISVVQIQIQTWSNALIARLTLESKVMPLDDHGVGALFIDRTTHRLEYEN